MTSPVAANGLTQRREDAKEKRKRKEGKRDEGGKEQRGKSETTID
jgi:hypothetical protein